MSEFWRLPNRISKMSEMGALAYCYHLLHFQRTWRTTWTRSLRLCRGWCRKFIQRSLHFSFKKLLFLQDFHRLKEWRDEIPIACLAQGRKDEQTNKLSNHFEIVLKQWWKGRPSFSRELMITAEMAMMSSLMLCCSPEEEVSKRRKTKQASMPIILLFVLPKIK